MRTEPVPRQTEQVSALVPFSARAAADRAGLTRIPEPPVTPKAASAGGQGALYVLAAAGALRAAAVLWPKPPKNELNMSYVAKVKAACVGREAAAGAARAVGRVDAGKAELSYFRRLAGRTAPRRPPASLNLASAFLSPGSCRGGTAWRVAIGFYIFLRGVLDTPSTS